MNPLALFCEACESGILQVAKCSQLIIKLLWGNLFFHVLQVRFEELVGVLSHILVTYMPLHAQGIEIMGVLGIKWCSIECKEFTVSELLHYLDLMPCQQMILVVGLGLHMCWEEKEG